jgi:exopolysaccharide biosynthesis polyprenyl glycosylphosphotransferase
MPSDNLGVGVLSGALASSASARSLPPAVDDHALPASRRARGLNWVAAAVILMVGDAAVVAGAVALAAALGAVPDGSMKVALLGLPPLVVLAMLGRGLYGAASGSRREFPMYSISAAWVHGLGGFLLLRLVVVPGFLALVGPLGSGAAAVGTGEAMMTPTLLAGAVLGLLALLAWRFAWRMVGPTLARPPSDRVVIVGDYVESLGLLPRLRAQAGVEVVGVIEPIDAAAADAATDSHSARTVDGLQVRSGLEELGIMVRGGLVDTALVAPGRLEDGSTLRRVLEQARISTLDVKILPRTGDEPAGLARASLSRIGDLPVIELQRRPLGRRALLIKRLEDLIVGGAMLVAAAPVMAVIAVAIRMETKGPIFFRQPRVGLNGNVFEMFKFRSMHHHAVDPGAVRQTQRGDPRVTRVGAILRRHSLDELPQILNVLRGDMSIVGPRPHALAMTAQGMALEEAAKDYPARFRMKPGITGWAQTNGWRGNVDTVEKLVRRVEHDLFYIEHWSLGLDLLILRKTVSCVFSDETAY